MWVGLDHWSNLHRTSLGGSSEALCQPAIMPPKGKAAPKKTSQTSLTSSVLGFTQFPHIVDPNLLPSEHTAELKKRLEGATVLVKGDFWEVEDERLKNMIYECVVEK